jgi:hypothetical protein
LLVPPAKERGFRIYAESYLCSSLCAAAVAAATKTIPPELSTHNWKHLHHRCHHYHLFFTFTPITEYGGNSRSNSSSSNNNYCPRLIVAATSTASTTAAGYFSQANFNGLNNGRLHNWLDA